MAEVQTRVNVKQLIEQIEADLTYQAGYPAAVFQPPTATALKRAQNRVVEMVGLYAQNPECTIDVINDVVSGVQPEDSALSRMLVEQGSVKVQGAVAFSQRSIHPSFVTRMLADLDIIVAHNLLLSGRELDPETLNVRIVGAGTRGKPTQDEINFFSAVLERPDLIHDRTVQKIITAGNNLVVARMLVESEVPIDVNEYSHRAEFELANIIHDAAHVALMNSFFSSTRPIHPVVLSRMLKEITKYGSTPIVHSFAVKLAEGPLEVSGDELEIFLKKMGSQEVDEGAARSSRRTERKPFEHLIQRAETNPGLLDLIEANPAMAQINVSSRAYLGERSIEGR